MTLILSVISPVGVAIAADSMLTKYRTFDQGNDVVYHRDAAKKLRLLRHLHAAVGMWGAWDVGSQSGDEWLDGIESDQSSFSTIEQLAHWMAKDLNLHMGPSVDGEARVGVQVVGYVDTAKGMQPTMWHIHDGPSQRLRERGVAVDPTRVNANHDLPPDLCCQGFSENIEQWSRTGDYQFYAQVCGAMHQAIQQCYRSQRERRLPWGEDAPSLAAYLRCQIQLVERLYALSGGSKTVGGRVDSVWLTPQKLGELVSETVRVDASMRTL